MAATMSLQTQVRTNRKSRDETNVPNNNPCYAVHCIVIQVVVNGIQLQN